MAKPMTREALIEAIGAAFSGARPSSLESLVIVKFCHLPELEFLRERTWKEVVRDWDESSGIPEMLTPAGLNYFLPALLVVGITGQSGYWSESLSKRILSLNEPEGRNVSPKALSERQRELVRNSLQYLVHPDNHVLTRHLLEKWS